MFAGRTKRPVGASAAVAGVSPRPLASPVLAAPVPSGPSINLISVPAHSDRRGERGAGLDEDSLERDADRAAEQLARRPTGIIDQAPAEPLAPHSPGTARSPPPAVGEALRGPGQPLAPAVRRDFEAGFGWDFTQVRVHADAKADAAARSLGALAFTWGRDIAFRSGRYAPGSSAGRALLAHEIAHVVQQGGNAARLQLKEDPGARKVQSDEILPVRVYIKDFLGNRELLLELIKQHFGAADDAEAEKMRASLFGKGGISGQMTQADVDRGYVWVQVNHPMIAAEQARRRRYFEEVSAPTDAKLIPELKKEPQTPRQRASVDELIRQLEAAGMDPAAVLDFLSGALAPQDGELDVAAIVAIAPKIPALRSLEAWEYKSRTSERTSDPTALGASLDRFAGELAERQADQQAQMQLAQRLLPICGPLYARYREWKEAPGLPAKEGPPTQGQLAMELDPLLVAAGFPGGVQELDSCVQKFEQAFAKEAARRLDIALDQHLHQLMIQEERYRKTDAAALLFDAVSATGAALDYQEADEAASASVVGSRAETDAGVEEAVSEAIRSRDARNAGDAKVLGAAQGHPLVSQHDFGLEKLAQASDKSAVVRLMLENIESHRKDIARVKAKLDDPSLIFGNDEIFLRSLQSQGFTGIPCLEKLLRDHKDEVEWEDFLEGLALDLLFILIGLIPGGGIVTAGIGLAYDAWGLKKATDAYLLNDALYGAEVTTKPADPTDLILSAVDAGLSLSEFGKELWSLPGAKGSERLITSRGGDPDLRQSVTFTPPKTEVGKTGVDGKRGKSTGQKLSAKDKKQRMRAEKKKQKRAADRDRRIKEETRKKSAKQGGKAINKAAAESSELDQTLGIMSLGIDVAQILNNAKEVWEAETALDAVGKADKDAAAIIARGKAVGLSPETVLQFVKLRLGGASEAEVEAAMKAAAAK